MHLLIMYVNLKVLLMSLIKLVYEDRNLTAFYSVKHVYKKSS